MSIFNWYYEWPYEDEWERKVSRILIRQRVKEDNRLIEETISRKNTTKEESRLIPPDIDEMKEFGIQKAIHLPFIDDNEISETVGIYDSSKLGKIKVTGRPQKKIRTEIPKKTKILLVKTRGGICELCNEAVFQQYHHIDGDPTNHESNNLKLLCYECHKEVECRKKKVKVSK